MHRTAFGKRKKGKRKVSFESEALGKKYPLGDLIFDFLILAIYFANPLPYSLAIPLYPYTPMHLLTPSYLRFPKAPKKTYFIALTPMRSIFYAEYLLYEVSPGSSKDSQTKKG